MIRLFLLSILTFFLTACATGPRYDQIDVKEKELVYVTVPKHLVEPCVADKPTSKEDYLKLKPHEREQYLADYTVTLLTTIKECNIKLSKIRKLNSDLK